ncbi:MAG TPA: oligosaccharide flippase family protein [Candidatus Udaeobacter sp.]|jgi:O-antigen/teichoic acid export membrane protein|nr:oligosaccharide flippase family protein [Candidatus Udaeobacter sp.]
MSNIEIAQSPDRLRDQSVKPADATLDIPPPAVDAPAHVDKTGVELKRGAFLNTIAMLASNFRGIFTFLVARLLGPAALGLFSVAWSTTDIISKIGVLGLDNAITTFIARSEAVGDRARSRTLFRIAVALGVVQSIITAGIVIVALRFLNNRLHVQPQMVSALALVLCAMPGLALYRISTAVSRGMKVMQHDIYSRGMTEPIATTLAFLLALVVGFKASSPEVAAILGTAASGLIALRLASTLFRNIPAHAHVTSSFGEARSLVAYAAPISIYQLINAFIARLDLLMLGYFVGRAPGVTLATVGVYSAVIGTANGLRKVNQSFNPIFAPVVAGMTATGDHDEAAATYARLAEWMLWILLPLVAVLSLAGGTILLIYGPAFQQGGVWLGIVALASAVNAFVALGETVIMVQRPHLNLLHSCITCAVAVGGLLWLIPRFGAMGAAAGILLPYIVQGILRYATLRWVFHWKDSWSDIRPPLIAAGIATVPALMSRAFLSGIVGQVTSAAIFLAVFGLQWWRHHVHLKRQRA